MEVISLKLVKLEGIVKSKSNFLRVNIQTMLQMDQEETHTFILQTVEFIQNFQLLNTKTNSTTNSESDHKKHVKQPKITSTEETEEWNYTNKKK